MTTKTQTLPTADLSNVIALEPLPIESDHKQIAGRLIMLYGQSGLGKSTNGKWFAKHYYELTGLPVRGIFFEDSAKLIYEPLIDLGIMEAVWMSKAKYPFTALRALAAGKWPKDGLFVFEETGKVTPKGEPIVFDRTEYTLIRPGQYSAYVLEGAASGGESLLEFCRENHLFLREQDKDAVAIGGAKIAAPSQTAYNVVQMDILSAVKGLGMLPVERVLITSHEYKGEDEDTNKPMRGPACVGKALSDKFMKYVGLQLHLDAVRSSDGKQITERRLYFERHPDFLAPNLFYPAKTTIPAERLADLKQEYPLGYFVPGLRYGTGLDAFLKVEAKLIQAQTDEEKGWKQLIDQRRLAHS